MTIESELTPALRSVAEHVVEHDDLLERVWRAVDATDEFRRRVAVTAVTVIALVAGLTAIIFGVSDRTEGSLKMDWWILELITDAVLIAAAIVLGPLIKRFGRSYAGDVFRANPRTGKSFLALTDVAYYLIFIAYILFTMRFEPAGNWADTVVAEQMQHEVARVGGILLIIGLLHTANIVALPMIGRLLTMNRQLDDDVDRPQSGGAGAVGASAVGTGQTFVLRIEPAPPTDQS